MLCMNITIDETTARMAVIALRERADNMRREARLRSNSGAAFIPERARLRSLSVILDQRADSIEAQYTRKAQRDAR